MSSLSTKNKGIFMDINGCRRVTDILGWFQDFENIPKFILEKKANIGTRVHESIENHLRNEFSVISDDIKGYMMSFIKWINETNIAVALTERRYFNHEIKLTGQIDCLYQRDGKLTILDFKTSSKPNHKIWKLQGAFYYILARQENPELNTEVTFLHLLPDGSMASEYYYDVSEVIATCYSILDVYQYFVKI